MLQVCVQLPGPQDSVHEGELSQCMAHFPPGQWAEHSPAFSQWKTQSPPVQLRSQLAVLPQRSRQLPSGQSSEQVEPASQDFSVSVPLLELPLPLLVVRWLGSQSSTQPSAGRATSPRSAQAARRWRATGPLRRA